jgi:hypothetical protein
MLGKKTTQLRLFGDTVLGKYWTEHMLYFDPASWFVWITQTCDNLTISWLLFNSNAGMTKQLVFLNVIFKLFSGGLAYYELGFQIDLIGHLRVNGIHHVHHVKFTYCKFNWGNDSLL